MSISIYKGTDKDSNPVAFFDRENVAVLEMLFEMADDVSGISLTSDISVIDMDKPFTRIGEISFKEAADPAKYRMKLYDAIDQEKVDRGSTVVDDKKKPVGKPDVGRKPSAAAGTAVVQSVLFDKKKFTVEQARAWLSSSEKFGDYGVEETETAYRFRQYDPQHFSSFKTGVLTDGVQAVFGITAGAEVKDEAKDEIKEKTDDSLNRAIAKSGLTLFPETAAIIKADEKEERFVLSMVLEPNDGQDGAPLKPDTQDDIYSADAIRKTAHDWMDEFGQVDISHNWQAVGKNEVGILESYLAPVSFDLGGYAVIKGSWMLGLRIKSDELWKAIKDGEIGAYSVGGSASRVPVEETGKE